MMRFTKWQSQVTHQIVGKVSGGWKALGQSCPHGLGPGGHIGNHAGCRGNGDAKRVGGIEDAFLVLLHVLAIGQRKPLQNDQKAVQRTDDPAGLGADKFGRIRIPLLRHD